MYKLNVNFGVQNLIIFYWKIKKFTFGYAVTFSLIQCGSTSIVCVNFGKPNVF